MSAEPRFESRVLETGLEGDVEIPRLGTWDGAAVYCTYSNNMRSIWIQRTDDAGRTWSAPVEVLGLSEPRYLTDANLLVDRDRITVFGTHVLESVDQPGAVARSVFRTAVSADAGRTWSPTGAIPLDRRYVCGCVHAPVWLDGDTVVMGWSWDVPAQEGRYSGSEGAMHLRCGVLISPDRGRTWTPGADVDLPGQAMGADEPAIVRLRNGDLLMVVRTTTARPYETTSRDGGRTWGELRPAPFQGYNTPSALLRLRDGALVRAWNNSPTNRFPLVVSVSPDDGRSWSPPRTVTAPQAQEDGSLSFASACYPSLAEAQDGTVLLAWWQRTAQGRNSVWMARFNRAWVEVTLALPPARRIVAFGDSITVGARPGVSEYQTFRHLLQEGLGQLGLNVEVINAGQGSDTTERGLARLDRDVLAERPALVLVMFGVNDAAMVDGGPVARTEPRVSLEAYRANLRSMVGRIRAAGATVLLCTPTPMSRKYVYQDIGAYARDPDINYLLRRYAVAVGDLARELDVPRLDTFSLFTEPPAALELIEDGCHPYVKGHARLAAALLEPVRRLLSAPASPNPPGAAAGTAATP